LRHNGVRLIFSLFGQISSTENQAIDASAPANFDLDTPKSWNIGLTFGRADGQLSAS
jgi:hypothetical protein